MRFPQSNTGKVYDPVFLFMLGAVALAIGSSFALRAVVGIGPSSARAADQVPDPSSDQSPAVDAIPASAKAAIAIQKIPAHNP